MNVLFLVLLGFGGVYLVWFCKLIAGWTVRSCAFTRPLVPIRQTPRRRCASGQSELLLYSSASLMYRIMCVYTSAFRSPAPPLYYQSPSSSFAYCHLPPLRGPHPPPLPVPFRTYTKLLFSPVPIFLVRRERSSSSLWWCPSNLDFSFYFGGVSLSCFGVLTV